MSQPSKETLAAGMRVLIAVAGAIKSIGSIPSGHLYARLMGSMTLDQYNALIGILKRQGLVKESGHLLTWVGGDKL